MCKNLRSVIELRNVVLPAKEREHGVTYTSRKQPDSSFLSTSSFRLYREQTQVPCAGVEYRTRHLVCSCSCSRLEAPKRPDER
jgi:hypothetical protein